MFTTVRPAAPATARDMLQGASRQSGKTAGKVAAEFARLSRGPGRLNLHDYVQLRLFDDGFVGDADRLRFTGRRRNSELVNAINWDRDAYLLAADKVAGASYLRAHGFPAPPAELIYVRGLTSPAAHVVGDPATLADGLRRTCRTPLFGKPVGGLQSLGALALEPGADADGLIVTHDGLRLSPEALAAQIDAAYPRGYVFQPRLRPAPELAAATGGALATVRMITVREDGRGRMLRACLKLPGAGNAADNYWRAGNRLARLHPQTGEVLAATQGSGLALIELDLSAADGAAPLRGLRVPDWRALVDLACEAQTLLAGLPLIGWDIAATDAGPMFVEVNATPDAFLNQLADRRGYLEPALLDLAARARVERRTQVGRSRSDLARFVAYRG